MHEFQYLVAPILGVRLCVTAIICWHVARPVWTNYHRRNLGIGLLSAFRLPADFGATLLGAFMILVAVWGPR